jgi:heme/copper-type cytochrome/quinol oxidase subunit 1
MHSLVRRYLKTGIAFLLIGLAIGLWLMGGRELAQRHPSSYAVSAHTHAILVGFVMMMILGVALWLFPRPASQDTRYSPRAAEVAYWLLTFGTSARIAGELARTTSTAPVLRVTVFVASLLQVIGIALFFFTMWSRIRPAGSHIREQQGERF